MIRVSGKELIIIIVGAVGGIVIYLSTWFQFLQTIADSRTANQVAGWMIAGWIFHKILWAWIGKVVDFLIWRSSYDKK